MVSKWSRSTHEMSHSVYNLPGKPPDKNLRTFHGGNIFTFGPQAFNNAVNQVRLPRPPLACN